jgi:hypothetical protein
MHFLTCVIAIAAAATQSFANAAPLVPRGSSELVSGKYIIQLRPDTDVASIAAHHSKVRSIQARNLARRSSDGLVGRGMEREFQIGDFKAYAGTFDKKTVDELKALPEVNAEEEPGMARSGANIPLGACCRTRLHHDHQFSADS